MPKPVNVEDLDLKQLANAATSTFVRRPRDLLEAKTWIRDAIVERLSCSAMVAERITDTLIARRMVVWPLK